MSQAKTIEISTETYEILHSLQQKLEKILHKKVSFDALCKILFTLSHIDGMILDMSELLRERSLDKELNKDV